MVGWARGRDGDISFHHPLYRDGYFDIEIVVQSGAGEIKLYFEQRHFKELRSFCESLIKEIDGHEDKN